jgi:hypothetical protein
MPCFADCIQWNNNTGIDLAGKWEKVIDMKISEVSDLRNSQNLKSDSLQVWDLRSNQISQKFQIWGQVKISSQISQTSKNFQIFQIWDLKSNFSQISSYDQIYLFPSIDGGDN